VITVSDPISVGPNAATEQLLSLYGLGANGWVDDIGQSDTDRLLAALLLELRDESLLEARESMDDGYHEDGVGDTSTATYYADSVDTDGDWERVDLGFVADSIDLRFTDDVTVAFKEPDQQNAAITYTSDLQSVTDIPAETHYVWLKRAESAESDPTVQLEAWE